MREQGEFDGGAPAHALHPAAAWVVEAGLEGARLGELFDGFCDRLVESGMPILRAYAGVRTLHPLYDGFGFVWHRGQETVTEDTFSRGAMDNPDFLTSPFHHMIAQDLSTLRVRLDEPGGLDFPVFAGFRTAGATDYFARAYLFAHGDSQAPEEGVIYSFITDRPSGFTEAELAALEHALPPLSLAIRSAATYQFAGSILATYIGRDAGRRVLDGDIERGAVTEISAVLFYADLRGFTRLADTTPQDELVAMLDDYLDRIAAPVHEQDGEVLKFMGDGLLAVFEIGDGNGAAAAACAKALVAARDAWRGVRHLNQARAEAGKSTMELDVALHLGDVFYGNVGSVGRLDFTVIGPAVNEASRIEAKARDVAAHLVVSETFWKNADGAQSTLVSLGRHALRDIEGERELFTLKPEVLAEALR